MKKLLFIKEGGYKNHVESIKQASMHVKNLIDSFNILGFTESIKTNDLQSMVENPKKFLYQKITAGEKTMFGNIKIDEAKAFDIIVKPEGWEQFIDNASQLSEKLSHKYNSNPFDGIAVFEISNNEVTIKESYLMKLKDDYSYYLNEQKSKQYEAAQKIAEMLNIVKTEYGSDFNQVKWLKTAIINSDNNLVPNHEFFSIESFDL